MTAQDDLVTKVMRRERERERKREKERERERERKREICTLRAYCGKSVRR